jgi:Concanavalin A-like lectin/glucanases superfamily
VAATYDGANAVLYVNGLQVGTRAQVGTMIARGDTLRIGKGSDIGGPIEVWNGQIDEARLWPFARTQGEIQATMNKMLVGVPGLVSTWNLDGFTIDTSGGQHATLTGAVTFTPNTLALTVPLAPIGTPVGSSTAGCLGPLHMSAGSVATAGNLAFAPVCTRAPANAIAFLVMSFQSLSNPLPFAGVNVWVDLNGAVAALASVNGLGAARYPLPIPATVTPGFSVALQYGFIDPCGPQGITASNALSVPIQ